MLRVGAARSCGSTHDGEFLKVNLRQLKYFVGVVDAGNMTRAADQLHVAQTALGAQIKQLEDDLGVSLLVRHSRGVDATKSGRRLYDRAVEILKLVEDTRREVIASKGNPTEAIRLGITLPSWPPLAPRLRSAQRNGYPK